MHYDIVVIGAGAAGLVCARVLASAGHSVQVVEARSRLGGRIHTIQRQFSQPVEAGAEFIHGDALITSQLLKAAAGSAYEMNGRFYEYEKAKLLESSFESDDWNVLVSRLKDERGDKTLNTFLKIHFSADRYKTLRKMARKFVEGFDAADPEQISVLSLKHEWSEQDEDKQPRIEGGYQVLIDYLAEELKKLNVPIHTNSVVSTVVWSRGNVKTICENGAEYRSAKLLITVPLGVLQNELIRFEPSISVVTSAAKRLGYGGVIKFHYEFSTEFWNRCIDRQLKDLRFVFSDATIPTWWSQLPVRSPILTGWLGGPKSFHVKHDPISLHHLAVESLCYLLNTNKARLVDELRTYNIADWVNDRFSMGAYSYRTVDSYSSLVLLKTPLAETLFFAGEAAYDGVAIGTVEAAFVSGKEVAETILRSFNLK